MPHITLSCKKKKKWRVAGCECAWPMAAMKTEQPLRHFYFFFLFLVDLRRNNFERAICTRRDVGGLMSTAVAASKYTVFAPVAE